MKCKLSLDGDIECDKACAICGVIEIEPENRWRRYKAGKIICCELYVRGILLHRKGEYHPGKSISATVDAVQCGWIQVTGGGDAL